MARARDWLTRGVIAAVATGLIAYAWTHRARFAPLDSGSAVPEYAARSLDGDTIDLASLRGRVVLLNVWATWCTPCVKEMPALQRLHERFADDGLSIVAVSVDATMPGLGAADVRGFVEDLGITFTVLVDPSGRIEEKFHVTALPMTFIIDRDGRIREKVAGAREWDAAAWISRIRQLLDG